MYQTEAYVKVPISSQSRSRLAGVCVLGAHLSLQRTPALRSDFREEWIRLHETWKGKSRKDVERHSRVETYRGFYSQMGLDPDRNPPSVQVLVQRFLRGEVLNRIPIIHPIVDAVNTAAVETMVPLGVFDASSIKGNIVIDLSQGGEHFHSIGAPEATRLPQGIVVLRDDERVLSQFCNRDSEAQKVTENTHTIWLLGCQVPGITAEEVAKALSRAMDYLGRHYVVQPC